MLKFVRKKLRKLKTQLTENKKFEEDQILQEDNYNKKVISNGNERLCFLIILA